MKRISLILLPVVVLFGCDEEKKRPPLPNWNQGFETSGEGGEASMDTDVIQEGQVEDIPDYAMGLGIPADVRYPYRLREIGTSDAPCAVGGANPSEMTCVLEMDELDLYNLGFSHDIVVPEGMCDFLFIRPYIFQNWGVADPPSEVVVEYDMVYDGGVGEDSDDGLGRLAVVREVNAVDGVPLCDANYNWLDGPNCCVGKYSYTEINHYTGEIKTEERDWGGKYAYCFAGGAWLREGAVIDDDCWPRDTFIYLNRDAYHGRESYKSIAIERGTGSNVFLSNYYDPLDHNGTVPMALAGELPVRPMYRIECVDDAWEMIAVINLVVREWNSEEEFDIDRDPDVTGVEDEWDHPIDDLSDFETRTPGDDTFPQLPVPSDRCS